MKEKPLSNAAIKAAPQGDGAPAIIFQIPPVSPEMREAGALVLQTWRDVLDSESLAEHVYTAMVAAK